MKSTIIRLLALSLCTLSLLTLFGCAKTPYEKFVGGKETAIDMDGKAVTIQTFLDEAIEMYGGEYAIYNVLGDDTEELVIRTAKSVSVFALQNESFVCLHKFAATDYVLLNNGSFMQAVTQMPTSKVCYQYVTLDENGKEKEFVTFTSDVVAQTYTFNNKSVSKTEYDSLTKPYLDNQKNDQIVWNPLQ